MDDMVAGMKQALASPFVEKRKGIFEAERCASCGELVFVDKLRVNRQGQHVCKPCSEWSE